jgi:predicted small secreted protein
MDNRQVGLRLKKLAPAYLLLAILLLSCGCETTGGAGSGFYSTTQKIGRGISKDARSAYSFLQSADRWMRENLW